MATKPSSIPLWATDGGSTVEPTTGEKQAGHQSGERTPARWQNWWQNLVYLWMVWLDAFESEDHTWTGAQTFDLSVTAAGGLSVTTDVLQATSGVDVEFNGTGSFSCAKDADFTGNVSVLGGAKTLHVRALSLEGSLDPLYLTPLVKKLHLAFTEAFLWSFESAGSVPWPTAYGVSAGTHFAYGGDPTPDSLKALWQVRVPEGATITAIEVLTWLSGGFNCDFGCTVGKLVYGSGGTYTRTQETTNPEETINRLIAGSDGNGFKWDAIPNLSSFQAPADGLVEVQIRNTSPLANNVFGIAALRVSYTMGRLTPAV